MPFQPLLELAQATVEPGQCDGKIALKVAGVVAGGDAAQRRFPDELSRRYAFLPAGFLYALP